MIPNPKTVLHRAPVLEARKAAETTLALRASTHYLKSYCHAYDRIGEFLRLANLGMRLETALKVFIAIAPDSDNLDQAEIWLIRNYDKITQEERRKLLNTYTPGKLFVKVTQKMEFLILTERAKFSPRAFHNYLVTYCDSYERLHAIMGLWECECTSPDQFIKILGKEWEGFDNVAAHVDALREILDDHIDLLPLMMNAQERRAWDKLPDEITVYRGCNAINRDGLCWSLCPQIAFRFTGQARYAGEGRGQLLTGTVKKKDAVIKLGRMEKEVVSTRVSIVNSAEVERWTPGAIYHP